MILYLKDTQTFLEQESIPGLIFQGKLNPNKKVELIDSLNGEILGSGTVKEFM